MTHQDRSSLIHFKGFLVLIAVIFAAAATILIILSTSAATVTGRSPFYSISLVEGANTGILGPDEQRWFRLKPGAQAQSDPVEQALTLIYTPDNGSQREQIAMQIFEEKQLQFFNSVDAGHMVNLGAGQVVSRDDNPETGELFWTGWLPAQASYYIQLINNSDAALDYWLFTDDVYGYPLGATETIQSDAASAEIAAAPPPAMGSAPQAAITLNSDYGHGNLKTGQEIWYNFSVTDADGEFFEAAALTMVITPNDDNRVWRVSFDVITAGEIQNWLAGSSAQINNVGAGSVVRRDNNPQTGEQFWGGWLIDGEVYYVRIRNGADIPIDYWLFTGDVYNPELGNINSH